MSEIVERVARAMCVWQHGQGAWEDRTYMRDHFHHLARAAIEAMREPMGLTCMHGITMDWQSIDTAPKDGQDIIVLSDNGIRVAHWSGGGLFMDWFIPLDGSVCSGGNYAKRATHWMPLPAPPVALNADDN